MKNISESIGKVIFVAGLCGLMACNNSAVERRREIIDSLSQRYQDSVSYVDEQLYEEYLEELEATADEERAIRDSLGHVSGKAYLKRLLYESSLIKPGRWKFCPFSDFTEFEYQTFLKMSQKDYIKKYGNNMSGQIRNILKFGKYYVIFVTYGEDCEMYYNKWIIVDDDFNQIDEKTEYESINGYAGEEVEKQTEGHYKYCNDSIFGFFDWDLTYAGVVGRLPICYTIEDTLTKQKYSYCKTDCIRYAIGSDGHFKPKQETNPPFVFKKAITVMEPINSEYDNPSVILFDK